MTWESRGPPPLTAMPYSIIEQLRHHHDFSGIDPKNVKRTTYVILLTSTAMIAEIVAGTLTGSMALTADGWHMATHAFALGITWFAWSMANRYKHSSTFSFGTGKFGILSAWTSALFLAATSIMMIVDSIDRLLNPLPIHFQEAIIVAVLGLIVNAISITILHKGGADSALHGHHHDHGDHHTHDRHHHDHHPLESDSHNHSDHHQHHHHEHHHDHNMHAAYLHVIADAMTSIFAIVALLTGMYFGWNFMDPIMGIVGALMIAHWSWGLLRSSGMILLDGTQDDSLRQEVVHAITSDNHSEIGDLHIWHLNSNDFAAAISIVTDASQTPLTYAERLQQIDRLKHTTIEVHSVTPPHSAT